MQWGVEAKRQARRSSSSGMGWLARAQNDGVLVDLQQTKPCFPFSMVITYEFVELEQ